MVVQICHFVNHILLQYYRAEVICFLLLLYIIRYKVNIARIFHYYYEHLHLRGKSYHAIEEELLRLWSVPSAASDTDTREGKLARPALAT